MKHTCFFVKTYVVLSALVALVACDHHENPVLSPESEQKGAVINSDVLGFYVLNQGNMGSNKTTLDYYDFTRATYTRDLYPYANPSAVQGLGDTGNDLRIYGSRLYAVINGSNVLEVMDAATTKRLGTVNCPNCRCLTFDEGYAYLTSYAGPILLGNKQIGYVAKIDTATLQVVDTCHVGFQPEGLAVVGDSLYVANSGGYLYPEYDSTLSVLDLRTFTVARTLTVGCNPQRVVADGKGRLWVTCTGDYAMRLPKVVLFHGTEREELQLACDNLCVTDSDAWVLDTWGKHLYHLQTDPLRVVETFSLAGLAAPYAITVIPSLPFREGVGVGFIISDAGDFVAPGTVHVYDRQMNELWSVRAGDIPCAFCFRQR